MKTSKKPPGTWPEKSSAEKKICKIEDCDHKYYGCGYCNKHYQQFRKGTLGIARPKFERTCTVEGCERVHYARGYCTKHYQQDCAQGIGIFTRRLNGANAVRDAEGRKFCATCGLWHSPKQFARHHATSDRLQQICRACVYAARELRQYGLTKVDVAARMQKQEHRCEICRADISKRYVVDHDHACCDSSKTCGKCVRGLLCDKCNLGLGSFQDSIPALHAAIDYLTRKAEQT